MKIFLLIALVAGASAANKYPREHYETLFTAWKGTYDRTYAVGSIEHETRLQTFSDHFDHMEDHNKRYDAGEETHYESLTQFADMTAAEFQDKILDRQGFLATEVKKNLRTEKSRRLWGPKPSPSPPPGPPHTGSIDWRSKGAVTPVKNQGQCGSCWTFSTTGSVEGVHFLATNNLVSFSEQQIVSCCHVNGAAGCNGGIMDSAFEYIVTFGGLDTEESYPYTSGGGNSGQCNTSGKSEISNVISGHTDVGQTDADLQTAVTAHPVSIAVDASSGWQLYGGGTLSNHCGTQLDHGVLAVGYTPDYWIVKNSWATTWGEQGYIYLSRTDGCSAGECGLQSQASFPTTGSAKLAAYADLPDVQ